jgi:GMP synthase-like glutamine amidotransferase
MTIRFFQHVEFETPGALISICKRLQLSIEIFKLYETSMPEDMDFDCLVIMGGPMNIFEEDKYPFLAREKSYIQKTIEAEKKILGICLGSQLLAHTLGAKVYHGNRAEIGWFPIQKTSDTMGFMPDVMTCFHWHGDTFELPQNAINFYRSDVTSNQAFLYKNHILGLQFHLEMDREVLSRLIDNCRSELVQGESVMSEDDILLNFDKYSPYNQKTMENLFRYFLKI